MTHWNTIYNYEEKRGLLTHKNGRQVGTKDAYGYLVLGHKGKSYKVHRIIWEMLNGAIPAGMVIDHINQNPSDNRICNLRLATKSLNAFNCKVRADNKHKMTGVSWKKDKKRYKAYITINQKQIHLGYFREVSQAIKARLAAEKKYLSF